MPRSPLSRSISGRLRAVVPLLVLPLLAMVSPARADDVGPATSTRAPSEHYAYPIEDPYAATVLGTPPALRAAVPDQIDLEQRSITLFDDRKIPKVLWSENRFRYSLAAQKDRAPLIFLIAGTGARFNSGKNSYLQKVFYQAGMSVVNISSPTHPDFIVSASRSSVPGFMEADVQDLYTAMKRIWEDIGDRVDVSEFYIAGYSLGGTQSAFLARLDEEEKTFDFKKVLLINPAVSLKASVNRLDNMVRDSVPGGAPELQRLVDDLFRRVAEYLHEEGRQKLDAELLYHAAGAAQLSRQELRALIGISFRISLARMLFTSDVMTGSGNFVSADTKLTRGTRLLPYLKAGGRWSFSDYVDEVLVEFWSERRPVLDRDALILAGTLGPIQDYLRRSDRVAVMTNADDPILDAADLEFLRKTFAERATIYPSGGHCGNLMYEENVESMLAFLQGPPVVSQGVSARVSPPGPAEATPVALQRVTPQVAADIPGFLDVRDPMEGANRRTYIFNAGFDRYVLLPAVRGYEFITPRFVRTGIRNVFKTIDQATTFVNYVLQARPKPAGQTLGRLGVNLTVGVLGLWDPATRMGMPEYQQNFGQTLARWGSGAGPYFVIPMLGPSSVRGATGTLVDRLPHILLGFPLLLAPVEAVDTRLHTPFRYRELGTPFEYDMVRFLSAEREKLLTLQ